MEIITQIILLWSGTSLISAGITIAHGLALLKSLADKGFKLDIVKIPELAEQLDPNGKNPIFKSFFIPGKNILLAFERLTLALDLIVPMTNEEKDQYTKNPSIKNAYEINIKGIKNRVEEDFSITIKENEEEIDKLNKDSQFLSKKEQLEELEQIKKEAISLNEKKSPEINTDMNLTKNFKNL